jgi:hypothetical protein
MVKMVGTSLRVSCLLLFAVLVKTVGKYRRYRT